MNPLITEYEKLRQLQYHHSEIEQLLFLYGYTIKNNCFKIYTEFLSQIKNNYNKKQLEQLIKCITHNTPYKLLLNPNYSVFVMNEIRRFLEDTLHEKGIHTKAEQQYYELGRKMLESGWNEDMIYQLRRFVKGKKIASYKTIFMISDILFQYKIKDWMILNIVHNKFSEMNSHDFENWILYDFSNWLEKYNKLDEEQKNRAKVHLFASLFR